MGMAVDTAPFSNIMRIMTVPNALTFSRIILSPLLFISFFLGEWLGFESAVLMLCSWLFFLAIEASDLLDGMMARKLSAGSDFGKVLDPFADSVSRITYFVCFTGKGIMPFWILLLLIYRDLTVAFVRILMIKKGMAAASRLSGKIKAWVYALAGIAGMIRVSLNHLSLSDEILRISEMAAGGFFLLCALIAVLSTFDYVYTYFSKNVDNKA